MKNVAFITYRDEPELTADDATALEPLARLGFQVTALPWDSILNHPTLPDPATSNAFPDLAVSAAASSPSAFDAVVLRSCWNYHLHPTAFRAWIDAVATSGPPLWNPPDVVRWNLDKRYLLELSGRGVPIPETRLLQRGSGDRLETVLHQAGFSQAVVKPAISLSAWQTWRVDASGAAALEPDFQRLLEAGDVLVQAFVPEVLTDGELSLVFLGGVYSHAVRKRPKPGDFRVQADFGGTREVATPSPSLVAQAEAIVRQVDASLLYARVDGIDVNGRLVLMELELIDPVLFLRHHPEAPERFARAIAGATGL